MTTQPVLTDSAIRSLTSDSVFTRGELIYRSDAVQDVRIRGTTLLAVVEGSSYDPYRVVVELDEGGVVAADCSCPFQGGSACKHIVAVLLHYKNHQEAIQKSPTVDSLLADLDRATLQQLLTGLMENNPHLIDWMEGQPAILSTRAADQASVNEKPRPRHTPIDTTAIRQQVRYQMRPVERYDYLMSGGVVSALTEILEQAGEFIEQGDSRNGLTILLALAEETISSWWEFDDSDGEFGSFFEDLGKMLAEALLSTDLAPEEHQQWLDRLTVWQEDLSGYGLDEPLTVALGAIQYGWDYGPLQNAMRGHITEKGAWDDEAPSYADELAIIRLAVLERQGRHEEYLNLAEAESQSEKHATMLVKLGRIEEARAYGLEQLATAQEALALSQILRERGHSPVALEVAEGGLALWGPKLTLGRWLRDFAAAQSHQELALRAAVITYEESAALEDYQAVEALAGEKWTSVKQGLLAHLAEKTHAYGRIDILLYEGLVEEAIQAVDKDVYSGYGTVEKVVEAAWQTHPDWVIDQCKRQAEPIMDSGKSRYYHHAARWLEKARRSYIFAGREAEWRRYCQGLISKHHRKYSLVPRLRELLN